jgi:hypothetical protein
VAYVARGTLADASSIGKVKAMLKRAMQVQLDGGGFALVEILSNCPVGWGMTPPESIAHLADVAHTYPVGVLVDRMQPARPAQLHAPSGAAVPTRPGRSAIGAEPANSVVHPTKAGRLSTGPVDRPRPEA